MSVVIQHTSAPSESEVPPRYVHKRDSQEVFLTAWEELRANTFLVSARWPTGHRFYTGQGNLHDPLLFAETVRQCFPLLAHAGYAMPFGHHLIWQYLTYEVVPPAMGVSDEPAELDLYVTCSDIRHRRGQIAALTLHVIALRDGVHLGTAQARFSCHAPPIYRRLRGGYADLDTAVAAAGQPSDPVAPGLVARTSADDVVLSPTGHHDRWLLRTDTSHPILFDHPVDHAPGMLLLEAARQAAHITCGKEGLYPVRFESTFLQFSEFDSPSWVTAQSAVAYGDNPHRLQVLATQGGETTFTSTITAIETHAPAL